MLFVGEKRSPRAIELDVRWQDEALAAKPLFAALRACDIDPAQCRFTNWFEPGGPEIVQQDDGPIVALGQRVSRALTQAGIPHLALVHPAARGAIRRRDRYIAHVQAVLGQAKE